MGKSYITVSKSLFANDNTNYIPEWINNIDINNIAPLQEKVDVPFTKEAAFNTGFKVSRDDRDFNSRSVNNSLNNNRLILAAKTELAKFLSGHYYTVEANKINNGIELITNISHVPAVFSFQYIYDKGRVKAAKLFNINTEKNEEGEYPFSKSGLNECLNDLKTGKIKTATKAKSYKAYTITLEEIIRRFNGDHRAALDKCRELVASQDLIGVGSNTFATCYAIDSLFPQLKKEGNVDNAPVFEFVKNAEHVAANPNASAASLIVSASKKLHELFTDFKIESFERNKDKLIVTADVLHDKKRKHVAFNFGIDNEQIQGIAYVNDNCNNIPLTTFMEENEMSNVLDAFSSKNKKKEKRLNDGIILTKEFIYKQLKNFIAKDNIDAIINNWIERELIIPVNSNTYMSKMSFYNLLDCVNTKLLNDDEQSALMEYAQRVVPYLERIKAEDNVRDYDIVFSPMIRLTNLYNRLFSFIKNFKVDNVNEDCTKVYITSLSERGPEQICICASYDGNKIKDISTQDKKTITAALNIYKKQNSKKNVFAKSIFSQQMLENILSTIFHNVSFPVIQDRFKLQKIGNNCYASQAPISTIINIIAKENLAKTLTKEERKDLLNKKARRESNIIATYYDDVVRDNIEYSSTIRLASACNKLSKQLNNFSLLGHNSDCSSIKLMVNDEQGSRVLTAKANYNDNNCVNITIPDTIYSEGLALYKQANKNNIFAKSIFSQRSLNNVLSNIFKDSEKATELILNKVATRIGPDFYACKYPLSVLINTLSKNNFKVLTEEERKDLLDIQAKFNTNKITASYIMDNDTRKNPVINKTIRLANLYPSIEKQYKQFNLINVNDDATQVEINHILPLGFEKVQIKVAYDNNHRPSKLETVNVSPIKENEVVSFYQQEHGKQLLNKKAVFSKNMLKNVLKPFIKQANINEIVNQILDKSYKLGNDFYASDQSLISLLNSMSNLKIDRQIEDKSIVNRNDIEDTGIRDVSLTDTAISFANKATDYLNQFFKNFNVKGTRANKKQLYYVAEIFDEDSGLSTPIQFIFEFDDHNKVNSCQAWITDKYEPIEKVKQAFAANSILSKYLKYHTGKRTKSPIIISASKLINDLSNLTDKNKDELKEVITKWQEQNRITKIASNAFASNYTIEQLLSMSSLKALTDEEIKDKLSKKFNLLKLSRAYTKDNDTRKVEKEWTLDEYINFIRSGLNKISTHTKILNANINNNKLCVTAEIGYKGLRHNIDLTWDISQGKPDSLNYKFPYISPLLQKYTDKYASKNEFNIKFNLKQLEDHLFGYVDKESVKKACLLFEDKNILTKNGNYYLSHYSIPELLRYMEKYNLIDQNKVEREINAAKKDEVNTINYKASDEVRTINGTDKNYMDKANDKLRKNIKLAVDNKLITKNKANNWLKLLENNNNLLKVHKEFTTYLGA